MITLPELTSKLHESGPRTTTLYLIESARRKLDALPPETRNHPAVTSMLQHTISLLGPNPRLLNQHLGRGYWDMASNVTQLFSEHPEGTPEREALNLLYSAFNAARHYAHGRQERADDPYHHNRVQVHAGNALSRLPEHQLADEHTLHQHVQGPTDQRFDPHWRTPDAVNLASEIVQTRNTDLLPILADALEEAGCNQEGILHQLRHEHNLSTPAHWVIQQILG